MTTIEINIYRAGGSWYGARWVDGEHDGCDELPCDGDADEATAREAALSMPLVVSGERVVRRVHDGVVAS